jgi:hypothetical protein
MSHYTVLVIGPDIERQLAPFQENNMGDCPREYMEFIEDADGDVDEITGKKGYWENPNAKWDWYRIGGRWSGFFRLKHGVTAAAPTPGYEVRMGLQDAPAENTADSVCKGDIDFEGMRADARHDAALEYDYVSSLFAGLPAHTAWETIRAKHEGNHEAARKEYWSQPGLAKWNEATKLPSEERRKLPADVTFGDPDKYLCSREEYLTRAANLCGTTFAVLKDGKWYERGKMGWWATVTNEKDAETWTAMFANLIDSLPDDTLLTVVDCHI